MSKLHTVLQAFIGNPEAAVTLVGEALETAVITMARHGTRAPVDEAIKFIDALTGRSDREKALKAGLQAVRGIIKGIQAGKSTPEAAKGVAGDVAREFVTACAEYLTTPRAKAVKPAADVAAKALKALAGLTDAQMLKALATNEGRDLYTRLHALKMAQEATEQARATARAAAAAAQATQQASETAKTGEEAPLPLAA